MKSFYYILFAFALSFNALAVDRSEIDFLYSENEFIENNNLMLSKAYINENPEKALIYALQELNDNPTPVLKAQCFLQIGIIYTFSSINKSDLAIENYLKAKEIFKKEQQYEKIILVDILRSIVYHNIGDLKRSHNILREAIKNANRLNHFEIEFFALITEWDFNYEELSSKLDLTSFYSILNKIQHSEQKAKGFFMLYQRSFKINQNTFAFVCLDSSIAIYKKSNKYDKSITVMIEKAKTFELLNEVNSAIDLNIRIHQESIDNNYAKGIIYSCIKLADFLEESNRYKEANNYLKYLNKVKTAEGEKELAQRILLAEKEKNINLQRERGKNEIKYQAFLTKISIGIAIILLSVAIYIFWAYRSKSKITKDLLNAYNNNAKLKEEKDKFLAYTSHEIRTPLSAVVSASDLLEKSSLNKDQKSYLKTLKSSANNILFLINDILDLAKLEKSKIILEEIEYSPIDVINNAIEILTSKALHNRVKVIFNQKKDFQNPIIGDPMRIQQIVINLLDNAIKYAPDGEVKINLRLHDENIMLVEVIDNGKGISAEKLNLIFKPYTQEEKSSSRQYGGTGLGLAICDQLIRLMNGSINCESDSSFTKFTIILPIIENLNKHFVLKSSNDKTLNKVSILLVEDDEVNGELFCEMIADPIKQINIEWNKNGQDALTSITKNKYDIILMDLEMPIKNGFETSKEIRSNFPEPTCNIPILALTAHVVEEVLNKCIKHGINDCISKPFQFKQLERKIVQLLSENDESEMINIDRNKYLKLFIKSFQKDLTSLERAYQEKNIVNIEQLLHKMKGASLTMGFDELSNAISLAERKKLLALSDDYKHIHKTFKSFILNKKNNS